MNETCGRCGRRLKNPIFREIGYGRTCAAKTWNRRSRKAEAEDRVSGRRSWSGRPASGRTVTALKWSITTQERNALVETHLGCIWWTINKNRRLISAVGLDDEDVFQQLAIRMIRAVENYDPDKGKDLEQHIFAQLQYEILNCKDAAKVYGLKGAPYGARGLTVSLDALVESGCQICGGVA